MACFPSVAMAVSAVCPSVDPRPFGSLGAPRAVCTPEDRRGYTIFVIL